MMALNSRLRHLAFICAAWPVGVTGVTYSFARSDVGASLHVSVRHRAMHLQIKSTTRAKERGAAERVKDAEEGEKAEAEEELEEAGEKVAVLEVVMSLIPQAPAETSV
jgi:hypothetical protein